MEHIHIWSHFKVEEVACAADWDVINKREREDQGWHRDLRLEQFGGWWYNLLT